MKIIHTADFHLHESYPRRMEALGKVLQLGRDKDIDLLLIAGDLFDNEHQAQLLKGAVRSMLSDLPYRVVAIPGNHDQKAFADEAFYGDSFHALTSQPCAVFDLPDVRLVGVPYAQGSFSSIAEELRRHPSPGRTNILVLHCSWSLPHYTDEDYGGEDFRYLPVTEASLTGLGYDYILAGHFHSSYRQRQLPCGALFVYSGSPISITAREQGRRAVNYLDEEGNKPLTLDTWYCQVLEYNLRVTNTDAILQQLARELTLHPDEHCALTVRLTGYSAEKESDLHARLQQLIVGRNNTNLDLLFKGAGHIYSDSLYQRIVALFPPTNESGSLDTMLLDAFSQLSREES